MTNGYNFYFSDESGVLTFPITPSELTIKVGSKNKVVTLISEGEINILKSPSLTEVKFDARFPMRKYPYSRNPANFQTYFSKFKELKENKKSFRFIVARSAPDNTRTWDTNLLMALEDFEIQENANEGDDVIISFNLKQYKPYGVVYLKKNNSTTSTSTTNRTASENTKTSQTYVVKAGDCLWSIAKKFYGNGALYTKIYEANKAAIAADAKKHGKPENGHWIFVGLKLIIPAL